MSIDHLPRFKNFGFFSFPSKTSQYGETNAMKIKIKAINVKQRATRRFLLCAPILMDKLNGAQYKHQKIYLLEILLVLVTDQRLYIYIYIV